MVWHSWGLPGTGYTAICFLRFCSNNSWSCYALVAVDPTLTLCRHIASYSFITNILTAVCRSAYCFYLQIRKDSITPKTKYPQSLSRLAFPCGQRIAHTKTYSQRYRSRSNACRRCSWPQHQSPRSRCPLRTTRSLKWVCPCSPPALLPCLSVHRQASGADSCS